MVAAVGVWALVGDSKVRGLAEGLCVGEAWQGMSWEGICVGGEGLVWDGRWA